MNARAGDDPFDVLVVEDDCAHAELVLRAFEDCPRYLPRIAHTLAEARAALTSRRPNLVIADDRLPDGRGIELVPREDEPGRFPVVVMTSHGDESVAVEVMKAGALDYLVKTADLLGDMPHVAERALREWSHITERRRAETELHRRELELRRAQKLEAIGQLASGVAHDFNNVLQGVAGCADIALARLAGDHPARSPILEIRRAAQRAASITGRLLAFSRNQEMELGPLDLGGLVRDVEGVLRPLLGGDILLQVEIDPCPCHVRGDAGQLEQILMNLASNARDAMPAGGTLTISVAPSPIGPASARAAAAGWVVLTVSDTGSGMTEATRARIFEPFFTTKEVGKGTGLGLPTVYGIVQQHGGDVELDSEPGRGTTFRIWLPRSGAAPARREGVSVARAVVPARTVLLVEDDPVVRLVVQHYLMEEGHRVLEASGVDDALGHLVEHGAELDLLLTDVVLPKAGGAQVLAAVRERLPSLPAIFMSAHPADVLVAQGRLPPGVSVLHKPFTAVDLSEAIAGERSRRRLRILLVEDDDTARSATAELLGDLGFTVLGAARGTEALALLASAAPPIDAVLTDLGLPDLAGDDLGARLRELRPGVPIVFISGRDEDDPAVARAVALPRTAFARKPVDIGRLAQMLRTLAAPDRAPEAPVG